MSNVLVRDSIRADIISTLKTVWPQAQDVDGGVAFLTEVVDEDSGKQIPVEIRVTAKNTVATARSEAYDLDAAVAAHANKPGRKTADPAKTMKRAAEAAAAAERKAANLNILRTYVNAGNLGDGKIPSQIHAEIPEFQGMTPMAVGSLLKVLTEEGVVSFTFDEKRHKVYTAA